MILLCNSFVVLANFKRNSFTPHCNDGIVLVLLIFNSYFNFFILYKYICIVCSCFIATSFNAVIAFNLSSLSSSLSSLLLLLLLLLFLLVLFLVMILLLF